MSSSSPTRLPLSAEPACKNLAMAIDSRIPAERASDYLHDFYETVRVRTVESVRLALLRDGRSGLPAGEISRLLDQMLTGGEL